MRLFPKSFIVFLLLLPFLAGASEYSEGVKAKVLLQASTTGNGDPVTYFKTDQPEITVMAVDIAPGAETGWHIHTIPVYAYVVSGSLSVNIEGKKTLLFNAGDVIIEVVNVAHNGFNIGSEPVKLIVFYTGAKDTPLVFKTSAP